jgi:hypothetical protein
MARDDGKRKSLFDDDEDEEQASSMPGKKGLQREDSKLFSGGPIDSATIDQKLAEIKAILDQTHQLYQHYFNGIEKRPPTEKARMLEARIAELHRVQLSTPTAKFKISQFILHYNTFRDLWDRKLRDKERA